MVKYRDGFVPEAYVICHTKATQSSIHIEERLSDSGRIARKKNLRRKERTTYNDGNKSRSTFTVRN